MGPAAQQLPHVGKALHANGTPGLHFRPSPCMAHGIICNHHRIIRLLPFQQVYGSFPIDMRGIGHGAAVQCHRHLGIKRREPDRVPELVQASATATHTPGRTALCWLNSWPQTILTQEREGRWRWLTFCMPLPQR